MQLLHFRKQQNRKQLTAQSNEQPQSLFQFEQDYQVLLGPLQAFGNCTRKL